MLMDAEDCCCPHLRYAPVAGTTSALRRVRGLGTMRFVLPKSFM